MDFDPSLLVVILFIVAPLLEKLLKGNKEPPAPPPQQRPRTPPRSLPEQRAELPRPQPQRRPQAPDENAVDILPEDLWAILTGQKPLPEPRRAEPLPGPVRLPQPMPVPTSHGPERGHSYDEEVVEEAFNLPAPYSADEHVPAHTPPEVMSLEPLEIDDEERHRLFHEKTAARRKPSAATQVERPVEHRFLSDHDLRRAMIMTEVLGKPRGLE